MSVLLAPPPVSHDTKVPLIHDAIVSFEERSVRKLLQNLGNIFVRHNIYNDYGLTMIHRHFDTSDREILVESIKPDKTISVFVPWSFTEGNFYVPSDNKLWKSYGLEGSENKFVVPQHWLFSNTGTLLPFEYLAVDKIDYIKPPPQEAVKELFMTLKELGVEKLVGIRTLEHFRETATWENTPDHIRASVVTHGEMPEGLDKTDMIKVMWRFDEIGKINEDADGCFICIGCTRCGTCGTCS